METTKQHISKILYGDENQYIIPVYQRNYSWLQENCQELWQDIIELIKNQNSIHFFGPIILSSQNMHNGIFIVVDGQQRLTTVSILLLAVRNFLIKTDTNKDIIKKINNLVESESLDIALKIKLKQNHDDATRYNSLFGITDLVESPSSNVEKNYNFFYNQIAKNPEIAKDIIESLKRLQLVQIILESHENPYIIFESINSKGVHLTAGDLIRNYMLMDLSADIQEHSYTHYWQPIEKFTKKDGEINIPDFIKYYLMFKLGRNVVIKDIYSDFKKFAAHKNKTDIFKDLLIYAKLYAHFVGIEAYEDKEINKQITQFINLKQSVHIPYMFNLFDKFINKQITKDLLISILKLVESYCVRNIIVIGSKGFNKFFIGLAAKVEAQKNNYGNDYIKTLENILCDSTFPSDEKFTLALQENDFYSKKTIRFLLDSFNNYGKKGDYYIPTHHLQIEHIMPQKPKAEYDPKIISEARDVIHSLGNLDLTDNNQKMGNKSKAEKNKIDKDNPLSTTQNHNKIDIWNRDEIIKRRDILIKEALELWKRPDIISNSLDQFSYLLSELDFDVTGVKINKIIIDKKSFEIKTWSDALLQTCLILYEFSPTVFIEKIAIEKDKCRIPKNVNNNVYVESNFSANQILINLKKYCQSLDYDIDLIEIELVL